MQTTTNTNDPQTLSSVPSLRLRLKILSVTRLQLHQDQNQVILTTRNLNQENLSEQVAATIANDTIQVTVSGVWTALEFTEGQVIYLIDPLGLQEESPQDTNSRSECQFSIDNSRGLLVLDPDNLLSCTAVSTALFCERKTWLNHVFAKRWLTSRPLLIGKLVHQLFQGAIRHRISDHKLLKRQMDELLCNEHVMLEAYASAGDLAPIREACHEYARAVGAWVQRYMLSGASANSALAAQPDASVRLKDVCEDIEDLYRSREYGLKGRVDVVGNFRRYNRQTRRFKDERRALLEVKTGLGRVCRSHTAQVELYQLLFEVDSEHVRIETSTSTDNTHNNSCRKSYLTYLQAAGQGSLTVHQVNRPSHSIKRDLLLKRNLLSGHFKDFLVGPPAIDKLASCRLCERLTECHLMGQLYDLDEDNYPHARELEREATGHLDEQFVRVFARLHERVTRLIHGNSSASAQLVVRDDQAQGFPIRLLQLIAPSPAQHKPLLNRLELARSPRFIENFVPSTGPEGSSMHSTTEQQLPQSQPPSCSWSPKRLKQAELRLRPFEFSGKLHLHCRVALSLDASEPGGECGWPPLATGSLCALQADKLTLRLDSEGWRQKVAELARREQTAGHTQQVPLIYRIDRLLAAQNHQQQQQQRQGTGRRGANELELMRLVLVRLLGRHLGRHEIRVRKLISEPNYLPQTNDELSVSLQMSECLSLAEELQQPASAGWARAALDAVATNNYFVIHERHVAPGQPLDRLTVAMCEAMISLDRRVLVVARELDNLLGLMSALERICKFVLVPGGKLTRAQSRFSSNLVRLETAVGREPGASLLDKYRNFLGAHERAPVMVTSYQALRANPLFSRQTFDYCVAYDCHQVDLLVGLAPLFACDRHILIDLHPDGQCPCEPQDTSLGQHLRALRPSLYCDNNRGDRETVVASNTM